MLVVKHEQPSSAMSTDVQRSSQEFLGGRRTRSLEILQIYTNTQNPVLSRSARVPKIGGREQPGTGTTMACQRPTRGRFMHVMQHRAPATVNAGSVPGSRMPLVPSDGATADDTVVANTGHPLQPAKLTDMQLRTVMPRNDELLKVKQARAPYRRKGTVMDPP